MAAARPKVACSPATVDEIRRKFAAFQYLEAGELVDELRRQLAGGPRGPEAVAAARELTRLVAEEPRLEERVAIARQALVDLTGDGSEWIVDRDDEIRMQHKMDAERYFSVRVESVLEGVRPADCLSIWREVSLYPEWFPLVTKGAVLSNVHPFEAVLHVRSPSPLPAPHAPRPTPPSGRITPHRPYRPYRPTPRPQTPIAHCPIPQAPVPRLPPLRAPHASSPPVPACARLCPQIISETRFMMIDLFLWGWGCDHSRDGIVLFCVRPTHARDLPTSWGITPPIHPSKLSAFKLLTPTRASASFDILIEVTPAAAPRYIHLPAAPSSS